MTETPTATAEASARKPKSPEYWAATLRDLADAPPEVVAGVRRMLAEMAADPGEPQAQEHGLALEVDSRTRRIREVLPALRVQHAQALLAQEGQQARMRWREAVEAVAEAITAAGWWEAWPHLQELQLLMGRPWGLGVFQAGVKRAREGQIDGVLAWMGQGLDRQYLPSSPADRRVGEMVGKVRDIEAPQVTDPIRRHDPTRPDAPPCELTWEDLDLMLEVDAFMREHEPEVLRRIDGTWQRRAAAIFLRCQEVERDRKPDEPRRGPFEIYRPQPKERPRPPKPQSLLEQLGNPSPEVAERLRARGFNVAPGMTEGELAHMLREWQLARTGMPDHLVALPQMRRGAPL